MTAGCAPTTASVRGTEQLGSTKKGSTQHETSSAVSRRKGPSTSEKIAFVITAVWMLYALVHGHH